jgi:hypothetical protein
VNGGSETLKGAAKTMKTMRTRTASLMAAPIAAAVLGAMTAHAQEPKWTVCGADQMGVAALANGVPQFKIEFRIYPPDFVPLKVPGLPVTRDGVRQFHQQIDCGVAIVPWDKRPRFGGKLDFDYAVKQTGPRTLTMTYSTTCDKEMMFANPSGAASKGVPSFWVGPVVGVAEPYFKGGEGRLETADGKTEGFNLPDRGDAASVKSASFQTASGDTLRLVFDPPVQLHRDQGQVRGWAQAAKLAAGTKYTQTVTIELPHAFAFEPENPWVKTDNWFELKFDNDFSKPGVIDMNDWQDKPAGKHGWPQEKNATYVFEDGTPVKFWGDVACICYDDKTKLDQQAAAMAKYGVNMARCVTMSHTAKGWAHFIPLSDPQDSMKFDPANLDRYDYGMAKFKEHGVYAYISPFYAYHLFPSDRNRLINYDEMEKMLMKGGLFAHSTYQLSVVCPDLQHLFIQWHLNLLNHVNPYTKLRYADDPAMAIWELNNEDNIFLSLFNTEARLKEAPTYNKLVYQRFAKLLKDKYGSPEALAKAWGNELGKTESLADATVNPWPKRFEGNTKSPRLADQMYFFYKEQSDYYQKWAEAVRATGYKGILSAGCWQAANWIAHLHNVRTDWEIGTISRHNYATADIRKPGVGLMSMGFQAVLDRSFIASEWSGHYRVGEFSDAPLVAAYGMGLQGWDGSNHMAWNAPGLLPNAAQGINATANSIGLLAQYAALSRMTRRMDVKEGAVVGNRRVSLPGLDRGDVGFTETFSLLGGANNKEFNCAVPNAAMAAGRVVMEFVNGPVDQPVVDQSGQYIDEKADTVRSTTGELFWDGSGEGYFTVNTAGSKAVVGYTAGRQFDLGEVKLRTDNPYAQIYVTALGKDETIANAKSLLLTTLARVVDKGTVFDVYSFVPVAKPEPKQGVAILEPVKATVELKGRQGVKAYALDHEGRKPTDAKPLPVEKTEDGVRLTVDGAQTKAVYYVVEFSR